MLLGWTYRAESLRADTLRAETLRADTFRAATLRAATFLLTRVAAPFAPPDAVEAVGFLGVIFFSAMLLTSFSWWRNVCVYCRS